MAAIPTEATKDRGRDGKSIGMTDRGAPAPQSCDQDLATLIRGGEAWLMERILAYARTHGYTRYTSTLAEAWRKSIAGLSNALCGALAGGGIAEIGAGEGPQDDPIARFAVDEARKHRRRGITLAMFLGLMKYYRRSYQDLVDARGRSAMRPAVDLFFDRTEIAFCEAWSEMGRDAAIGELQATGRELANEKNRYLTAFESMATPALLFDETGALRNWNASAGRLLGLAPAASGAAYYGDPELRQRAAARIARIGIESSSGGDIRIQLGTEERYVAVFSQALADVSAKSLGRIVVLHDVTDYARQGQCLARAESMLRVALDAAQGSVFEFDTASGALSLSPSLFAHLGMDPLNLPAAAADLPAIVHRRDLARLRGLLRRRRHGPDRPIGMELRLRRATGAWAWCAVSGRVSQAGGGEVFHGIVWSVDERHQAAEAERRREAYFQSYFHSSIVGMATTNLAKGWVEVNEALCEFLGYARDELAARTWAELTHPDDLAPDVAEFERLLQGEADRYSMDKRFVRKDGKVVHARIAVQCVRLADGRPDYFVAMVEDITDRKRLELELRARLGELEDLNARLEQAQNQLLQADKMAAVGQLAAGVAHEINNPVGFVYSNVGSLGTYIDDLMRVVDAQGEVEAALPETHPAVLRVRQLRDEVDFDYLRQDIASLLRESREGLMRVRKIVQDLKDFSHAGDSERAWTDLQAGLESTLNIVNNEIKYKANVVRHYEAIPRVNCVAAQLNQVFLNLLVNAAQAIDRDGTITVSTGSSGAEAWVEIRDTGCGIAPENLKRIFDPFYTTKPVGKGTGLGLSLSYSIVERHGGHIDVASEPGRGSAFRVVLPIGDAPLPAPAAGGAAPA